MGGGELHLESSRQPGHSKDGFWCRHNSKERHLSDLKVESAIICSVEIEHHGKSPQMINFTWIMQTRVSSISTHFSCIFILYELKLLNKGRLLIPVSGLQDKSTNVQQRRELGDVSEYSGRCSWTPPSQTRLLLPPTPRQSTGGRADHQTTFHHQNHL